MAQTVKFTIDGIEVEAPKGALIIRVAEELGIEIPRFCDHPLLDPAGACRQCLVEVEGQRKPLTACTLTAMEGMVVKTQLTSELARDAQRGIMEFLLINHPLDCPMCDKGGECPLQNQAMSAGRSESRFIERKREYQKPVAISSQVLLDRERCVLCQRCTRFSDQIAGDKFIDLLERGADQQIGTAVGEPFDSYFSGNTVQICPVGALTGVQYRFRARPFDLVSDSGVCEHCSAGCAQRVDHRRGQVLRRMAESDPAVNEAWNCDKGRWGFQYRTADRITEPLVRDPETKRLRPASWTEALQTAARGLLAAKEAGGVGVLTGGRLTVEDAYAYSKFARVVLNSNDIDFRARPLSAEEADFLAARVAGNTATTYADLERAPAVVLVGLEPEEECPILFLRLRKGYLKNGLRVLAVAPFASPGLAKLGARLFPAVPGNEPTLLGRTEELAQALAEPGAVLLVGERLAEVPGGFTAACELAERTGARLAWVPRRAGDRGAVEAGCLPQVLPGGRLVSDTFARAELAQVWDLEAGVLSPVPGRNSDAMLAAAANGDLGGLLVAGIDPDDMTDPQAAADGLKAAGFVVSCEIRYSKVTELADVVLPVASVDEKAGSYVNWEGRMRPFGVSGAGIISRPVGTQEQLSDARVLHALAAQFGTDLGCGDLNQIRQDLTALSSGEHQPPAPRVAQLPPVAVQPGQAVLATWHHLIDLGTLLRGTPHLAGTARPPVVRLSSSTAADLAVADGDRVTVRTDRGEITLPLVITDMPDGVVWLPANSPGSPVRRVLGAVAGQLVEIGTGGDR